MYVDGIDETQKIEGDGGGDHCKPKFWATTAT